ncbi:MAG: hypothetical protein V4539_22245 [Bacteroidota bacterium]
MKQIIVLVAVTFIVVTCFGQENLAPKNYKLNEEASGDLDKDGINEKAVVYNVTTQDGETDGFDREIIIYKKQKDKWVIWHRSKNAVKNSRDGGTRGDPFQGIEIKNGILIIYHSGGSNSIWTHTDKYRFQNNRFELIGFTANSGSNCEEWLYYDINITTGKIVVTDELEKCDDTVHVVYKKRNEVFTHKLSQVLTLEKRYESRYEEGDGKYIKIISPKYKHELYIFRE